MAPVVARSYSLLPSPISAGPANHPFVPEGPAKSSCSLEPEVGKVTLKSNGDEALSDESP